MKWNEIGLDKLREGEIFKSEGIPNRVYQVDELGKDVEGKFFLMASDLVRGSSELCFSGGGAPYYRLKVPGSEVIDAIAERLVESQEMLKQKTERFNELHRKWEAKRVEGQEDKWEDVDWDDIEINDELRWRFCNGEELFHRSPSRTVINKEKNIMLVSDATYWEKNLTRYQYQRLTKN